MSDFQRVKAPEYNDPTGRKQWVRYAWDRYVIEKIGTSDWVLWVHEHGKTPVGGTGWRWLGAFSSLAAAKKAVSPL